MRVLRHNIYIYIKYTYILQGVNGPHAFLEKKEMTPKIVCYTANVLDVQASWQKLCCVCVCMYVRVCI